MSSSSASGGDAFVDALVEEFLERMRAGERVTIEDYAERHPEHASQIRLLFPTLLMMEELAPVDTLEDIEARSPTPGSQQLGDYTIVREIGRGGMGVVYEAEQESLERRVALKVLPVSHFLDAHKRARFLLEARSAARLHHSNIVPVYSVGQQAGMYYYAMQLIRGHNLDAVLEEVRRKRMAGAPGRPGVDRSASSVAEHLLSGTWRWHPEDEAGSEDGGRAESPAAQPSAPQRTAVAEDHSEFLDAYHEGVVRIGLQVGEALAHAHAQGVIHRDIKPSNLILDLAGHAWVTDFGLAKADDSQDLTAAGDVVGTLRYLPPERFRGQSDARADIYGLGVTLYELLAHAPAFDASSREALVHQVMNQQPRDLRHHDPGLPTDLRTIVHKAIEKDPAHRYATAEDLAEDLRRCLENRPILARRANVLERTWRLCRRNPVMTSAVAIIVSLLATIAIVSVNAAGDLRLERNAARQAEDERITQLAEAKLREARAIRRRGTAGQRVEALAALEEASDRARAIDVRSERAASLSLTDVEPIARWTGRRWFDPDGRRMLSLEPAGHLTLGPAEGDVGPTGSWPIGRAGVATARWAPAGDWISLRLTERGESRIIVLRADAGSAPEEIYRRRGAIAYAPGPGRELFHDLGDGQVVAHDIDTGSKRKVADAGEHLARLAPSLDGRFLATIARVSVETCAIHDLATGELIQRLEHGATVHHTSWDPATRLFGVACGDGRTTLWDTASWQPVHVLDGHVQEAVRVVFSHDGKLAATSGWDSTMRLWSTVGGEQLVVAPGRAVAFGRGDDRLHFRMGEGAYGRGGWWRVHRSEVYQRLSAPMTAKGPWEVAFSTDGRWLAAGCAKDGARVWSLDDPSVTAIVDSGDTQAVRFDARDGSLLTISLDGLLRWPLERVSPGDWVLGDPEEIGPPGTKMAMDQVGDRRVVLGMSGSFVQGRELLGVRTRLPAHPRTAFVTIDPLGRFAATGTWKGKEVIVSEAASGREVLRLEAESAEVHFSADGRWFAMATAGRVRVFDVSDWSLVLDRGDRRGDGVGRAMAFGHDGAYAVVSTSRSAATIISIPEGQDLLQLEPPQDDLLYASFAISPDGHWLAASSGNQFVQLWNLRAMRGAGVLPHSGSKAFVSPQGQERLIPRSLRVTGRLEGWARSAPAGRSESPRATPRDPQLEAIASRIENRQGIEALEMIDRAVLGHGPSLQLTLARMQALEILGRHDEAMASSDSIPEPDDRGTPEPGVLWRIHEARAQLAETLGRNDVAMAALRAALEHAPSAERDRLNVWLALRIWNWDPANRTLAEAFLDETSSATPLGAGRLAMKGLLSADARGAGVDADALEAAIDAPHHALTGTALLHLAIATEAAGDLSRAELLLDRATAVLRRWSPRGVDRRHNLVRLRALRQRLADAAAARD